MLFNRATYIFVIYAQSGDSSGGSSNGDNTNIFTGVSMISFILVRVAVAVAVAVAAATATATTIAVAFCGSILSIVIAITILSFCLFFFR